MNDYEFAKKLGTTKGNLSKWKARGCPTNDLGKAKEWARANIASGKPRIGQMAGVPKNIPPPPPDETNPDYSWEAVVTRAKETELAASNAVMLAMKSREVAQLDRIMQAHSRSILARKEAEKIATEARLHSGELVHRETIRGIWREVLPALKASIERLPIQARGRCNPDHPEIAEAALKSEVKTILTHISSLETKF